MVISGGYDTEANNHSAVFVQGSGSTINGGSDVVIETTGVGAIGAYASEGGSLGLTGSTINTENGVAFGVLNDKGTVNLQGGTITTKGQTAYGVYSSGLGSNTDIHSSAITTSYSLTHAIYGAGGTGLTLNNTTLNTSGSGSYGIYLDGSGGSLTGANNTINSTHATKGAGIYISAGGSNATLDNTTLNITKVLLV